MRGDIRTKEDVEFHAEGFGRSHPAVNVKVRKDWRQVKLPMDLMIVDGVQQRTEPGFTIDWIEENIDEHVFEAHYQSVCESGWEEIDGVAREIFGPYVKVYSEGRQGGWAVPTGLPPFETWDATMLAKWRKFARACRALADDVPRATLESLYVTVFTAQQGVA